MKFRSMKKQGSDEDVTCADNEGEGCENYVHCAMLGDGMVGKTCLTLSYTQQHFTDHYTATVFDNYPVPVEVGGEEFVISLFDTRGDSNHESLRAYTYESSEVLVLCFSVCDRQSFYNVVNSWLPEIQRHTKGKRPLLLVGTQIDLRSSSQDAVTSEEGNDLARIIGADCYIECSARSQEGVRQVFEHVVFSALKYRRKKSKIFNRLFGDLTISNPLKNFSPSRLFETTSVTSCC